MIEVQGVKLRFDNNEVLKNISFRAEKSSITVILGKNGSGKSVLLKCIAGLLTADDGSVTIEGEAVSPDLYLDISTERAPVAYVFQKGGLFDSMTVFENVAFGMRRRKLDETVIAERVTASLQSVGLAGAEEKYPSELSGGMQKRVGLARSLCLKPDLILYDDPTAGLDPVLTDSIADLILEIREREKVTSIVVTHDLKLAEKIADQLILLYQGEAVFYGENKDFFSKSSEFTRQFIEGDIQGPIDIF